VIAVADSSFIIAVAVRNEAAHARCVAVHQQQRIIYVPQTTLTEVAYFLHKQGGGRLVASFIRGLPNTKYRIVPLETEDLLRTAEILEKYHDTRLDFVDATIAAVAERLNIPRLLTLDYRDFGLVRPRHIERFELLPPLE
jgi:predicted nucleic acid-binding protein